MCVYIYIYIIPIRTIQDTLKRGSEEFDKIFYSLYIDLYRGKKMYSVTI